MKAAREILAKIAGKPKKQCAAYFNGLYRIFQANVSLLDGSLERPFTAPKEQC